MLSRNLAIKRFSILREEIHSIKKHGFNSTKFKDWSRSVKESIQEVFGDTSEFLDHFSEITFSGAPLLDTSSRLDQQRARVKEINALRDADRVILKVIDKIMTEHYESGSNMKVMSLDDLAA